MKRIGLLHPIVVDRNGKEGYRLVAGERRLRVARMLGWLTVSANLREHLTAAELREIELEENENRKSLTEQERRRTFAAGKKTGGRPRPLAVCGQKPATGGPAQRKPMARTTWRPPLESRGRRSNAEWHAAAAECYPRMQGAAGRPMSHGGRWATRRFGFHARGTACSGACAPASHGSHHEPRVPSPGWNTSG